MNFVGKYIANLPNRTTYIRTLLCKTPDWNWSMSMKMSGNIFKKAHKPVLAYYDVTLKTKVSTDACKII